MISESEVRQLVAQTVTRLIGSPTKAAQGAPAANAAAPRPGKGRIIYEDEVRSVPDGGKLVVRRGARLSPLAGELIRQRRIQIVHEAEANRSAPASGPVALGADHGGFALKENLKAYLAELGYAVTDLGTTSSEAVDYPDFAYAVAKAVADGGAWRGIMVDGAGIGSAMVANKVPGVRASMCYDVSSASNAREHNDANVLTLGGQLIGASLARQIVKTWLATAFGGGRHARRVEKISAVEGRYLKK